MSVCFCALYSSIYTLFMCDVRQHMYYVYMALYASVFTVRICSLYITPRVNVLTYRLNSSRSDITGIQTICFDRTRTLPGGQHQDTTAIMVIHFHDLAARGHTLFTGKSHSPRYCSLASTHTYWISQVAFDPCTFYLFWRTGKDASFKFIQYMRTQKKGEKPGKWIVIGKWKPWERGPSRWHHGKPKEGGRQKKG
jgi:hypothetical protein